MFIAYKVPIDWSPDPDFVNDPPSPEYLGWRIGDNVIEGTSLWVINQVVETPTVSLGAILPPDASRVVVTDDLTKYGFRRQLLIKSSINEVEAFLAEQTAAARSA